MKVTVSWLGEITRTSGSSWWNYWFIVDRSYTMMVLIYDCQQQSMLVISSFPAWKIRMMTWSSRKSSRNGNYLVLCCIRPKYHVIYEFNLCWCLYSQSGPVCLIHVQGDVLLRHWQKLSNGEFGGNTVLHRIAMWAERDSEIQWVTLMVILM